jgi:two-component system invasion response regulator UvrY
MTNFNPLATPVRVFILEDHKFIGELLAQRLSCDHYVNVVGIANKPSAALHFLRAQRVDVALLDMEFGEDEPDGIEVAREMLAIEPTLRIIGLSAYCEGHYPVALLEAGGRGFLSKRANATEVLDAIRRVARGDLAISPDVAYYLATEVKMAGPNRRLRALTAKEVEVMHLIALGCSVKEVSSRLEISAKTVQSHRANMKRKLQLTTDVELCRLAIKAGITRMHEAK